MTSEVKTEHPYVVRNANVRGGRPVITGTSAAALETLSCTNGPSRSTLAML